MKGTWALAILAAALVLAIGSSFPASAQGGLQASLANSCVLANPGETVTNPISVSWPGSQGSVTLATVGSHATTVTVTITPASGTAPFNSTLVMVIANDSAAPAAYQLGIVAKSGSEVKIVLFTLRVVKPGEAVACDPVGLPLPDSTYVVSATSLGLGLLTQLVTTQVVDLNAERRMRAELSAFNKEKREATLAKDTAKLEKLKKRELPMRQAQAKTSLARMKVTVITIVPLFLVYYLMATFLGGYGTIVAVTPFPNALITGPNGEMVLFWWYFLCSFSFSSALGRLLHTTT